MWFLFLIVIGVIVLLFVKVEDIKSKRSVAEERQAFENRMQSEMTHGPYKVGSYYNGGNWYDDHNMVISLDNPMHGQYLSLRLKGVGEIEDVELGDMLSRHFLSFSIYISKKDKAEIEKVKKSLKRENAVSVAPLPSIKQLEYLGTHLSQYYALRSRYCDSDNDCMNFFFEKQNVEAYLSCDFNDDISSIYAYDMKNKRTISIPIRETIEADEALVFGAFSVWNF